jgi:hypothetical protein
VLPRLTDADDNTGRPAMFHRKIEVAGRAAQGGCEVGAVWGRQAVAVAAGCTPLPLLSRLLLQVGVVAGGLGILRT